MEWLQNLVREEQSPATCVFVLAVVILSGLALGQARYKGLKLGVAGVLFSGLIAGHFGLAIDHNVLEFTREFGLILFVYAVGLTIGPGFFNAIRAHGLSLNLIAVYVVACGVLVTVAINRAGMPMPIAVGLMCGATTNTPSLAAASTTLQNSPPRWETARAAIAEVAPDYAAGLPEHHDLTPDEKRNLGRELSKLPGLAYAMAYPFGVIGTILSLLFARLIYPPSAVQATEQSQQTGRFRLLAEADLLITRDNVSGQTVQHLLEQRHDLVISRRFRNGTMMIAHPQTDLQVGDIIKAVGSKASLDWLTEHVGEPAAIDLERLPSEIVIRWVMVSRRDLVGRTIESLQLVERFHVQTTRLRRGDVELTPVGELELSLGDELLVVGPKDAVSATAHKLGDSSKSVDLPDLIPLFVGVLAGVLLGMLPLPIPGFPVPVRLGLAGGPLIVALIFSKLRRIGPLVWFLRPSANFLLRELGIVLFLAAVGLKSGDRFVETLVSGSGLQWMAMGALITFLPLVSACLLSAWLLRVPYAQALGLVAGSMTDPPALAFATSRTTSEEPAIAYATVYPTTMILRILCAQILVLVDVAA